MHQPLLEPAVLVSENCPQCVGTGELREQPCEDCAGAGRLVHEVPMSEAFKMMQDYAARLTAPPPSMLRQQGTAGA